MATHLGLRKMIAPFLFCLSVVAILATPGPTNMLLAISGASVGLRRSWALVPAELLGYVTAILVIGLVVGPALAKPGPFVVIRVCITIYLFYLAIRLWRLPALDVSAPRSVRPRDVFVTTLLNPKAAIFALAIVPMHDPEWPRYLLGFCALLIPLSVIWICAGIAMNRGLLTGVGDRLVYRIGAVVIVSFAAVIIWPVLSIAVAA